MYVCVYVHICTLHVDRSHMHSHYFYMKVTTVNIFVVAHIHRPSEIDVEKYPIPVHAHTDIYICIMSTYTTKIMTIQSVLVYLDCHNSIP